jgi:hypothetical protein
MPAVRGFALVVVAMIVTSVLCFVESAVRAGPPTIILGMPVTGAATSDPAWISIGGAGVIVLGAGYGIVAFTLYGAGLLFATGQLAAGLVAFGQLAVGVLFFVAQLGLGLVGVGQVAIGFSVVGQGQLGWDGETFLRRLSNDLDDVLFVWRRRPSVPGAPHESST